LTILIIGGYGCKQKIKGEKYYIIIERESYSLITGKKEHELKLDSLIAPDNQSAFDSFALTIFGFQEAHRIVRKIYQDKGREDEYDNHIAYDIKSAKVYNFLDGDWQPIEKQRNYQAFLVRVRVK
jgi:hypothetical protein